MLMKKFSDSIGNRNRKLPAYSAVPQPTAPPRAPGFSKGIYLMQAVNKFKVTYAVFSSLA
jgi:hypothetical protein